METKNLIIAKKLSWIKPNAFITNAVRDGIINKTDLIKLLLNKKIAGYATDVFETEPVQQDHPFFNMNKVLMAPHCIA